MVAAAFPTESDLDIPLSNGRLMAQGTLMQTLTDSGVFVVFCHAASDSRDSEPIIEAAHRFANMGIPSYRYDAYNDSPHTRSFNDSTVETLAGDLETVLRTLRPITAGRKVVVIGHSLGALLPMLADQSGYDGLVLWEGTHAGVWNANRDRMQRGDFTDNHTTYVPERDRFELQWDPAIEVTRESLGYRMLDTDALAAGIEKPVHLVYGTNTVLAPLGHQYLRSFGGSTTLDVIKGASHYFREEDAMDRVISSTARWMSATFGIESLATRTAMTGRGQLGTTNAADQGLARPA